MDQSLHSVVAFVEAVHEAFVALNDEIVRRFRPHKVEYVRSFSFSKGYFEQYIDVVTPKRSTVEWAIELEWIGDGCSVTPVVSGLGPDDHHSEPMARLISFDAIQCTNLDALIAAIDSAKQTLLNSMDQVMALTDGWFPLRPSDSS